MFCPHKYYIRLNMDKQDEKNVFLNKQLKQIRINVYDSIQRNISGLESEISLIDTKNHLKRTIKEVLESSLNILKDQYQVSEEETKRVKREIINDVCFIVNILSLKSLKAMKSFEAHGTKLLQI